MAWIGAHPMVVVAVVAGMVTVIQCIWIWNHRLLGALDPDESGYIATAFHYRAILSSDPLALPRAIGGTGNGPLIPLLSVPLLWIGPDDPRTVLLMQPILMFVTALAVAGIARRLGGAGAAVVAGCAFLTLPTVVFATQTYWLGLGAAAFMALGIWALLESERLTNRWTYAFGACVGAMLLCRTMTLGFVPAAAVAGLVVAGRERQSLIGLAKAAGVAIAVAGPWWFVARNAIFDYLFSYGYGPRASLFGEDSGPLARAQKRVEAVLLGVGSNERWWLIVAIVSIGVLLLRRAGWPPVTRGAAAVGAAVVLGIAALASTSNNGVWFELPVIALVVPLAVAVGQWAPVALRLAMVVPVAVTGVLQLGCALWLIAPGERPVWGITEVHRVAQYEYGFEIYDPRFGPYRRNELQAAAADWWDLSTSVERYLHERSGGGDAVFTTSGNFQMFNTNTFALAAVMQGWTPRAWVPDTVGDSEDRERYLSPIATDLAGNDVLGADGRGVERLLVLALHDHHLFTPDEQVDDLHREAEAAGWQEAAEFAIPTGGRVVVLEHPDVARADG
jgi:hypothetical protein